MKSILILSNSIDGLFSFRKEVVYAVSEKYKVYISVPNGNSDKLDYFSKLGCEIVLTNIDRRGTSFISDLKLFKTYCRIIKEIGPVTVLTYTIKPNVYGGFAARLRNVPQFANITGLGTSIENGGLLSKFTIFLYKFGLLKAKVVFCQNSSIQKFCIKHNIGKDRILLPGSGVDLSWHSFLPYPDKSSNIRFLFIGRMMKNKGIEELLYAAKVVKSKYHNVEFHLLGDCEEDYSEILNALNDSGVIYWHGDVPDVRPYMKDAYATIHPSYHEGMANVLLETCAAGRPVITTNINGCKEAVDDGVNGFLCEVRNADDLLAKVEYFIRLPYERKREMGVAARRKMTNDFDRTIVVNKYMQMIDSIES